MYTANIHVSDSRIRVRAPWEYKDALKGLPGSRWQPAPEGQKGGWWTYPASPLAAKAVADLFAGASMVRVVADEAFQQLQQQAERIKVAQDKKGAQALPEIPVSKTSAWLHQKQAFWFVIQMFGGLPPHDDK